MSNGILQNSTRSRLCSFDVSTNWRFDIFLTINCMFFEDGLDHFSNSMFLDSRSNDKNINVELKLKICEFNDWQTTAYFFLVLFSFFFKLSWKSLLLRILYKDRVLILYNKTRNSCNLIKLSYSFKLLQFSVIDSLSRNHVCFVHFY